MIETRAGLSPDDRALAAFRVEPDADAAALLAVAGAGGAAGFNAERIDDHRRIYLEYEGPIPGGRGTVEKLAAGVVSDSEFVEDWFEVTIDFGAGPVTMRGARVGDGPIWRLHCQPIGDRRIKKINRRRAASTDRAFLF